MESDARGKEIGKEGLEGRTVVIFKGESRIMCNTNYRRLQTVTEEHKNFNIYLECCRMLETV